MATSEGSFNSGTNQFSYDRKQHVGGITLASRLASLKSQVSSLSLSLSLSLKSQVSSLSRSLSPQASSLKPQSQVCSSGDDGDGGCLALHGTTAMNEALSRLVTGRGWFPGDGLKRLVQVKDREQASTIQS